MLEASYHYHRKARREKRSSSSTSLKKKTTTTTTTTTTKTTAAAGAAFAGSAEVHHKLWVTQSAEGAPRTAAPAGVLQQRQQQQQAIIKGSAGPAARRGLSPSSGATFGNPQREWRQLCTNGSISPAADRSTTSYGGPDSRTPMTTAAQQTRTTADGGEGVATTSAAAVGGVSVGGFSFPSSLGVSPLQSGSQFMAVGMVSTPPARPSSGHHAARLSLPLSIDTRNSMEIPSTTPVVPSHQDQDSDSGPLSTNEQLLPEQRSLLRQQHHANNNNSSSSTGGMEMDHHPPQPAATRHSHLSTTSNLSNKNNSSTRSSNNSGPQRDLGSTMAAAYASRGEDGQLFPAETSPTPHRSDALGSVGSADRPSSQPQPAVGAATRSSAGSTNSGAGPQGPLSSSRSSTDAAALNANPTVTAANRRSNTLEPAARTGPSSSGSMPPYRAASSTSGSQVGIPWPPPASPPSPTAPPAGSGSVPTAEPAAVLTRQRIVHDFSNTSASAGPTSTAAAAAAASPSREDGSASLTEVYQRLDGVRLATAGTAAFAPTGSPSDPGKRSHQRQRRLTTSSSSATSSSSSSSSSSLSRSRFNERAEGKPNRSSGGRGGGRLLPCSSDTLRPSAHRGATPPLDTSPEEPNKDKDTKRKSRGGGGHRHRHQAGSKHNTSEQPTPTSTTCVALHPPLPVEAPKEAPQGQQHHAPTMAIAATAESNSWASYGLPPHYVKGMARSTSSWQQRGTSLGSRTPLPSPATFASAFDPPLSYILQSQQLQPQQQQLQPPSRSPHRRRSQQQQQRQQQDPPTPPQRRSRRFTPPHNAEHRRSRELSSAFPPPSGSSSGSSVHMPTDADRPPKQQQHQQQYLHKRAKLNRNDSVASYETNSEEEAREAYVAARRRRRTRRRTLQRWTARVLERLLRAEERDGHWPAKQPSAPTAAAGTGSANAAIPPTHLLSSRATGPQPGRPKEDHRAAARHEGEETTKDETQRKTKHHSEEMSAEECITHHREKAHRKHREDTACDCTRFGCRVPCAYCKSRQQARKTRSRSRRHRGKKTKQNSSRGHEKERERDHTHTHSSSSRRRRWSCRTDGSSLPSDEEHVAAASAASTISSSTANTGKKETTTTTTTTTSTSSPSWCTKEVHPAAPRCRPASSSRSTSATATTASSDVLYSLSAVQRAAVRRHRVNPAGQRLLRDPAIQRLLRQLSPHTRQRVRKAFVRDAASAAVNSRGEDDTHKHRSSSVTGMGTTDDPTSIRSAGDTREERTMSSSSSSSSNCCRNEAEPSSAGRDRLHRCRRGFRSFDQLRRRDGRTLPSRSISTSHSRRRRHRSTTHKQEMAGRPSQRHDRCRERSHTPYCHRNLFPHTFEALEALLRLSGDDEKGRRKRRSHKKNKGRHGSRHPSKDPTQPKAMENAQAPACVSHTHFTSLYPSAAAPPFTAGLQLPVGGMSSAMAPSPLRPTAAAVGAGFAFTHPYEVHPAAPPTAAAANAPVPAPLPPGGHAIRSSVASHTSSSQQIPSVQLSAGLQQQQQLMGGGGAGEGRGASWNSSGEWVSPATEGEQGAAPHTARGHGLGAAMVGKQKVDDPAVEKGVQCCPPCDRGTQHNNSFLLHLLDSDRTCKEHPMAQALQGSTSHHSGPALWSTPGQLGGQEGSTSSPAVRPGGSLPVVLTLDHSSKRAPSSFVGGRERSRSGSAPVCVSSSPHEQPLRPVSRGGWLHGSCSMPSCSAHQTGSGSREVMMEHPTEGLEMERFSGCLRPSPEKQLPQTCISSGYAAGLPPASVSTSSVSMPSQQQQQWDGRPALRASSSFPTAVGTPRSGSRAALSHTSVLPSGPTPERAAAAEEEEGDTPGVRTAKALLAEERARRAARHAKKKTTDPCGTRSTSSTSSTSSNGSSTVGAFVGVPGMYYMYRHGRFTPVPDPARTPLPVKDTDRTKLQGPLYYVPKETDQFAEIEEQMEQMEQMEQTEEQAVRSSMPTRRSGGHRCGVSPEHQHAVPYHVSAPSDPTVSPGSPPPQPYGSSPLGCGRLNPYCSVCRDRFQLVFVDEHMQPIPVFPKHTVEKKQRRRRERASTTPSRQAQRRIGGATDPQPAGPPRGGDRYQDPTNALPHGRRLRESPGAACRYHGPYLFAESHPVLETAHAIVNIPDPNAETAPSRPSNRKQRKEREQVLLDRLARLKASLEPSSSLSPAALTATTTSNSDRADRGQEVAGDEADRFLSLPTCSDVALFYGERAAQRRRQRQERGLFAPVYFENTDGAAVGAGQQRGPSAAPRGGSRAAHGSYYYAAECDSRGSKYSGGYYAAHQQQAQQKTLWVDGNQLSSGALRWGQGSGSRHHRGESPESAARFFSTQRKQYSDTN